MTSAVSPCTAAMRASSAAARSALPRRAAPSSSSSSSSASLRACRQDNQGPIGGSMPSRQGLQAGRDVVQGSHPIQGRAVPAVHCSGKRRQPVFCWRPAGPQNLTSVQRAASPCTSRCSSRARRL